MSTNQLRINFERLKQMIEKSSEIGRTSNGGLHRLALSEEDRIMRGIFKEWMDASGLDIRVDDFGNMYGRRQGKSSSAPVLVGSHLDTQPFGGRFDGVVGVLTALEVIHTLNEHQIETYRPIEIINFTNEEGARFEPPLLGSGGLSETFDKEYVYNRMDMNGNRFEDELDKAGFKGSQEDRIREIHSYLELHIEQGPILEDEGIEIGAVEGIKGMSWFELIITGEGGHAGPTPMELRRDAVMAAAKHITLIEESAGKYDSGLSVTVGKMAVNPNVTNCIPDEVTFSLDIRHLDDGVRNSFIVELFDRLNQLAAGLHVDLDIKKNWEVNSTNFHDKIVNQVVHLSEKRGCSVKRMYSGAGHDAKYINDMGPTGMIFLPSVAGISHVESELTLDENIEKGANVLLDCVLELANMEKSL